MQACRARIAPPAAADRGDRRALCGAPQLQCSNMVRRAGPARLRRVACEAQPPQKFSNETKLRSEAQAPFRIARQFIYGALGVSGLIGGGISFIQLVTGALGAPAAPPLSQSAPNLAIDAGVVALMAFLYKREEDSRQLQMSRISREERLGNLRVELSNGKLVKLLRLRGFARVVIAAGPAAEVARAVAAAEPFKQALLDRGVLFVPFATDGGAVPAGESDGDAAGKRWRAGPVYPGEWTAWFDEQTALAKIAKGTPVYVSLRMDGRVRASGVGLPPWQILATALPPTEGFFAGFLDGAPGRRPPPLQPLMFAMHVRSTPPTRHVGSPPACVVPSHAARFLP